MISRTAWVAEQFFDAKNQNQITVKNLACNTMDSCVYLKICKVYRQLLLDLSFQNYNFCCFLIFYIFGRHEISFTVQNFGGGDIWIPPFVQCTTKL